MNKKLILSLGLLAAVAVQPMQAVTKKQVAATIAVITTVAGISYWAYNYCSGTTETTNNEVNLVNLPNGSDKQETQQRTTTKPRRTTKRKPKQNLWKNTVISDAKKSTKNTQKKTPSWQKFGTKVMLDPTETTKNSMPEWKRKLLAKKKK